MQTKHGHFYFSQFDKKKKMSSGLEAVSGNGFVGVSLYRIRIADWVSVSIGGTETIVLESAVQIMHLF